MMLRHLGLLDHANHISNAVYLTVQNAQSRTRDMGGNLDTTDFTKAVISAL